MISPIHCDMDSYDSPPTSFKKNYYGGGLLLLEDAERAPEILRITIDSDVDEPEPGTKSDSEEDVVVLGEKKPTYQEITLEEDESGGVKESIVEKEKNRNQMPEETVFNCPTCDKSFRVESLLKFHLQMHNTFVPPMTDSTADSSSSGHIVEREHKLRKKKRHSSEHKEDKKSRIARSLFGHKVHKEKHKSHKKHKHKKSRHST